MWQGGLNPYTHCGTLRKLPLWDAAAWGRRLYSKNEKSYGSDITVETNEDGKILLSSPDFGGGEPIIMVDPVQVPALIEWLKEAAEELKPR